MKKTTLLLSSMLLGGLVITPVSADQVKTDVEKNSSVVQKDNTHEGFTIPDGFDAAGDETGHNIGQGTVEFGHSATVMVQPMGHENGENGPSHNIEGEIEVTGTEHCTVQQEGNTLIITPEPGYDGEFVVHIAVHGNTQEGTFTGDIRISQQEPQIDFGTVHGIMPTRPTVKPEPKPEPKPKPKPEPKPDPKSESILGLDTQVIQTNNSKVEANNKLYKLNKESGSSEKLAENVLNQEGDQAHNTKKNRLPNTGFNKLDLVTFAGVVALFSLCMTIVVKSVLKRDK